ncbi:MAG: DNA recombination protein RmuC [Candidatus Binataceae bacterium]|nr:DNA recombination protein RmuC [Candidatus Binataceae bacterium]
MAPDVWFYAPLFFSFLTTVLSCVILVWLRGARAGDPLSAQDVAEAMRNECDRIRLDTSEQARISRQELGDAVRGMQSALRSELTAGHQQLSTVLSATLTQLGDHQKDRLEALKKELFALTEVHRNAQEVLRNTIEGRLDAIRIESAAKLEQMRQTVDERLQTTLEKRLGDSFNLVSEQLKRVHEGLGEMQTLAAGVGDLKKVLSNVKVRGTWGEIQLGNLLEQFLSPEQYLRNAQTREGSAERVEFAVRLPGRNDDREVLLPIDAKFPQEDFERLILASENGDAAGVEAAAGAIEASIKSFAKGISDKYINPPRTTDIAILFLPTESLYAEVLRRPGLFESLQRDYHVTLAGPTTLTAILNALQMGFQTIAIEKRSSEVWQVLGRIRSEFNKYGDVVDKLRKQLNTAVGTIDNLSTRTRVMNRELRDVTLPEAASAVVLGIEQDSEYADEDRTAETAAAK